MIFFKVRTVLSYFQSSDTHQIFTHHITQHCAADEGEKVPLKKELKTFGPNQTLLVLGDAESLQPDRGKVVIAPWNEPATT